MRNGTANYVLTNGEETLHFFKGKDASAHLGVDPTTLIKCAQNGWKCKGYSVKRVESDWDRLKDKRLVKIWESMNERCTRKSHVAYSRYGGRGISVCEEWKDYVTFARWAIESGYGPNLTLDRLDNDKGYSPDNCRWATAKMQGNNKRNNHRITHEGRTLTLSEWAEETGIGKTTIRARLSAGWSVCDALTKAVQKRKLEVDG